MDEGSSESGKIALDDLLKVLENQTRRKILSKLTKESHYPLQLSKELNISQQSIMKHIKVLEDCGLVKSETVRSHEGPPRKLYYPAAHFSIEIYLSPDTFRAELKDQSERVRSQLPTLSDAGTRDAGEKIMRFGHELERCINTSSSRECLKRVSDLVKEINQEINKRESQRDMLIKLRSVALRVGREVVGEVAADYTTRNVLYYYIERDTFDINNLSEELDMRIKVIEEAIKRIFD